MKIRIKDIFVKNREIRLILDIGLRQLLDIVEGTEYPTEDFEDQYQGSVYKYLKELNNRSEGREGGPSNDPSNGG